MAVKSNQDEISRVRVRSSEARGLMAPIEHGGMPGLYPQKLQTDVRRPGPIYD